MHKAFAVEELVGSAGAVPTERANACLCDSGLIANKSLFSEGAAGNNKSSETSCEEIAPKGQPATVISANTSYSEMSAGQCACWWQ